MSRQDECRELRRKIGEHALTVRQITDDMLKRADTYDQAIGDAVEKELINEIKRLNATLAEHTHRWRTKSGRGTAHPLFILLD